MKKFYFWFVVVTCMFLSSCEDLNLNSDDYYNQQDDEELTDVYISEDIDVQLGEVFSVIQPNGVLDADKVNALLAYYSTQQDFESLLLFQEQSNELPIVKWDADNSFPLINFIDTNFNECVLRANYDENNVMLFSYKADGAWSISENNQYLQSQNGSTDSFTYESLGPDIGSGMTLMSPLTYYKYEGYNPLFLIESDYNQATFDPSNERGMERFMFYRFVGMGGGILEVDTLLFAVDTYTSLIFIYAIPTKLDIVMEMPMTTSWGSVDILATDDDGNKHLFFEYDPIGYVDVNHNFIMYDWYIERQAQINPADLTTYYPQFTGVSPYLIDFDVLN